MPAITYLTDLEARRSRTVTDHEDLSDALRQIRETTGEDWLVRSTKVYSPKRLFKKQESTIRYSLLVQVGKSVEYQVISLCGLSFDNSFEASKGSAANIVNFIIGYLCCLDNIRRHGKK